MFHLTTALDAASAVPLYEQLYQSLAAEMRAGAIPAGTRMPGKRRLAAELSVSVWEEPCDSGAEPAVPEQAVRDNSSTAANNVHNHFFMFHSSLFCFHGQKKGTRFWQSVFRKQLSVLFSTRRLPALWTHRGES